MSAHDDGTHMPGCATLRSFDNHCECGGPPNARKTAMTPEHTALVARLLDRHSGYWPDLKEEAAAAIRALSGEVERLTNDYHTHTLACVVADGSEMAKAIDWLAPKVERLEAERDTLRAEVAALRKDAENGCQHDIMRDDTTVTVGTVGGKPAEVHCPRCNAVRYGVAPIAALADKQAKP